jgi:hypothetical protein
MIYITKIFDRLKIDLIKSVLNCDPACKRCGLFVGFLGYSEKHEVAKQLPHPKGCGLVFLTSKNITDKDVNVGAYILNLGNFDIVAGSFTADFYLSFKCNNTRPPLDFEFMNGRASSLDKIIDEPNEKFYMVQANLNSPIDLKKFPFDSQELEIIIEDKTKTTEELICIPNKEETGIDESIAFVGWNMEE